MPNPTDPQEWIKRVMDAYRYGGEGYTTEHDVTPAEQVTNPDSADLMTIIREAEAQGEPEPTKPVQIGGQDGANARVTPRSYLGAYQLNRKAPEYEGGSGGDFYYGGEYIPKSLFNQPMGRSYIDPHRGDILFPELGPGMRIRQGEYNQGVDELLKQLLGP